MVDNILENFCKNYAHDLILSIWGEDARLYAEDFFVNDRMLHKYQNHIVKNLDHIKDKHILSIGSHTGWMEILAILHGANSVTCLEPRKKFTIGLENFIKKHQFALTPVCGIHRDVFDLNKKFDTIFAFNSIGITLDWMDYFSKLHKIADTMIFSKGIEELQPNTIKIVTHFNNHHWGGLKLNLQQESNLQNDYYIQENSKFATFKISQSFLIELCQLVDYNIIDTWQDDHKILSADATKQEQDMHYSGDMYFVINMRKNRNGV